MFSYFKFFVFMLFPPAAFLLALLVFPFPAFITKRVVHLTDAVLFWRPHPTVPLSLFWCVLLLSFLTFAETMLSIREANAEYQESKHGGRSERALIKLLVEQRNGWISGEFYYLEGGAQTNDNVAFTCMYVGFAFILWFLLHRYRSFLKKYYALEDKLIEAQQKQRSEVHGPTPVQQKSEVKSPTPMPESESPQPPQPSAPAESPSAPKNEDDKKNE